MKKVFFLLLAVILVLSATVVAYAEETTETAETTEITETATETETETAETEEPETETTEAETTEEVTETETVTEAAEASTETTETEVEEVTTEAATEADTETDELAGLLDVATPEQVETIRKYLEYGVSSLPVSEKVKLILLDYIDEASWILMAVAFVVFCVINHLTNKKSDDNAQAMTDNAIEIAEEGGKRVEAAKNAMENIEQEILAKLAEDGINTKQLTDQAVATVLEIANDVLAKAEEMNKHAEDKMAEVSQRETGLTEAVTMFSEIIGFMLEHTSSLPEWERDRVTTILMNGKAKIEEVTTRDESHEE